MAPKSLPPAAKQGLILQWFQQSMAAHSIKDLEKILPSVASINGMQVKDYIQALTDENLVRVEKIGSGNWYWSFASDAKKSKERVMKDLQADESKLEASIAELDKQIEEEMAMREDDNSLLENNEMDRKSLLELHETLMKRDEALEKELSVYSDCDPAELLRKSQATRSLEESARRWTDNIEAIECFMVDMTQDRQKVAAIMQEACGNEYTVGEGLKEI